MVFLLAPDHKRFFAPALACFGLCLLFGWICAQFYLPGKGFTYLIEFGGAQHERFLPALKAVNHYEISGGTGYDAQYYAQIAMEPDLANPALHRAVDSLPYRARRILLSWIAYVLGGGDPVRALQIFAAENLVCWFALALLFCRWAPPWTWSGLVRWIALLFTFGLCCSVRGALVDGPSLLLIAAAVALAEADRPWLAAATLGIAGLAKETNLLAGVILLPAWGEGWAFSWRWGSRLYEAEVAGEGRTSSSSPALGPGARSPRLRRPWRRAGLLVVAAAPLAAWLLVLHCWLGRAEDLGARNFALPFSGYLGKWREVIAHIEGHGFDLVGRDSLIVLIGLTVQWLAIVLRPRIDAPWWRVGAAYAALGVVLGPAVWEGYPGATARVLLPLTAAFVVGIPLGRRRPREWIILALGAVSILASPSVLNPPGRESVTVHGPRDLRIVPRTGRTVDATFGPQWYDPEKSWFEYWRWCRGSGTVTFVNPHPFAVTADIRFGLRANDARTVAVRAPNRTLWMGRLAPAQLREVQLKSIVLPPGETTWRFETLEPPVRASAADARPLTFSLRNLRIDLR